MSEKKKYKNYTAADIEKYHKGLLSPGEMNELERAALDDPFLADALEGYQASDENISSDLSQLKKKLEERVSDGKVISITPPGNSFKWWKVAAAVVILGGAGYAVVQLSNNNNKSNSVAVKMEEKKPNAPAPSIPADSSRFLNVDSVGVAKTDKQPGLVQKTNSKKTDSLTSGLFSLSEQDDVATAVTSPSEASANYKSKADTINTNEIAARSTAPVALEKRAAAADKKFSEGYPSPAKEAINDQGLTNHFRGRVKDANNNPLPFANITNTKDNVGTYADAKGNFTLISPDSVLDVRVRSVGFENNVARLKNNASNDVVMQDDQSTPAKVLSYQKPDTSRSGMANVKFEELEPADGWNNYDVYLANNLNIPEDLKRKNESRGQVRLSFEINQVGNPINIKVEKSLCEKCDEEAIRVVKQGPKWKKKNKKAKRITISVPFDTEQ